MDFTRAKTKAEELSPEERLSVIEKFRAMAKDFSAEFQEAKELLPTVVDPEQRKKLQQLVNDGQSIGEKVQWITQQIDKANAQINAVKTWLTESGTSPYVLGKQVGSWLRDNLGFGAVPMVIPIAAAGAAIWGLSVMGSWLIKYRTERARIEHVQSLLAQGVPIEQARQSAKDIAVTDEGMFTGAADTIKKFGYLALGFGGLYLLLKILGKRGRS